MQYSYSWSITSGAGFGAAVGNSTMITNSPSVSKLNGKSGIIGGSAFVPVEGIPVGGGGDFCIIPDSLNEKTYLGISMMKGVSTPGPNIFEFHGGVGDTIEIFTFNVFDVTDVICDYIGG